jgi:hypothetical protein
MFVIKRFDGMAIVCNKLRYRRSRHLFSDACLRAKVDDMFFVSIVLCRRRQNIDRNSSRGTLSINGIYSSIECSKQSELLSA